MTVLSINIVEGYGQKNSSVIIKEIIITLTPE